FGRVLPVVARLGRGVPRGEAERRPGASPDSVVGPREGEDGAVAQLLRSGPAVSGPGSGVRSRQIARLPLGINCRCVARAYDRASEDETQYCGCEHCIAQKSSYVWQHDPSWVCDDCTLVNSTRAPPTRLWPNPKRGSRRELAVAQN